MSQPIQSSPNASDRIRARKQAAAFAFEHQRADILMELAEIDGLKADREYRIKECEVLIPGATGEEVGALRAEVERYNFEIEKADCDRLLVVEKLKDKEQSWNSGEFARAFVPSSHENPTSREDEAVTVPLGAATTTTSVLKWHAQCVSPVVANPINAKLHALKEEAGDRATYAMIQQYCAKNGVNLTLEALERHHSNNKTRARRPSHESISRYAEFYTGKLGRVIAPDDITGSSK